MKQQDRTSNPGSKDAFKLSVPRSMLVFETTGFRLFGMVASRDLKGSLKTSAITQSDAVDFTSAVGEVLAKLRESYGKRLPKKAVLITPSAASDFLHLPVDPRRPRPPAQMKELARWDIEEIHVQQNDIWSIGALLQGRGHVSAEERLELELSVTAGAQRSPATNAYRDLVGRAQMEECLTMQEPLIGLDDELAIGCYGQSSTEEDGRYPWHCAGISDGLRSQWVQAFKKHGVFCSWIYPQLGAALPMVDWRRTDGAFIEVRQEQFAIFQLKSGYVENISVQPCPHGHADVKSIASIAARLLPQGTPLVAINASAELQTQLREALQAVLSNVEVRDVRPPTVELNGLPLASSMHGVTRHALKLCDAKYLPRIQAQPPQPPIWKSREFWPWVIIAVLLISIVSLETSMRVKTDQNELNLDLLDIEYEQRMQIRQEALKTQSEIKQLEETLASKENEIQEKQRRMVLLDQVILRRQEMTPGILEAIVQSIPRDVVVDVLEENDERSGFYLEGWARRDAEGQLFGNLLNQKLGPWNYKVADVRLSRGLSRSGEDGYVLKVRVMQTKLSEEVSDVQ
ncbi:hypothetical protein [Cerasicoccus frondis]|uniref:hypothetical protein n=1 Tax=Cerasicoccus frondis TaxID=490090 RepID=UPI00285287BE|nr:hypothetical protein [Cerasicoccus frondis]